MTKQEIPQTRSADAAGVRMWTLDTWTNTPAVHCRLGAYRWQGLRLIAYTRPGGGVTLCWWACVVTIEPAAFHGLLSLGKLERETRNFSFFR